MTLAALLLACTDYDVVPKSDPPEEGAGSCPEPSADYGVATDATCEVEPPVGAFEPVVEWSWRASAAHPGFHQVMAAPAAGDLDGDGLPEIVFSSFNGGDYYHPGVLTALHGDGSGELWSLLDAGGIHPYSSGGVAIGDFEGDGIVEVCAAAVEVAVLCVDGTTGAFRWAAGPETDAFGAPAFGDLDGDGISELVFGRQAFRADGSLLWVGAGGAGRHSSFVSDLDMDGRAEVIAGNTRYAADGTILWTSTSPEGVVAQDGTAATGDFDGDGRGDVVHVGGGVLHLTGTGGVTRWSVVLPGGGSGGPPTVADFDNDGRPEIGVAGATTYTVFDTDGTVLWSQPVQDASSNVTGSSVFDFEGDGASDVVYGDEQTLRVYDGATGAVKVQIDDHGSGTLYEYPLILDIDADGASEIVLASNDYAYAGWTGITVIGDARGTWRPSRGIWNQYAYSISNVADDGSIPADPVANWTRWNNFRAGGSLLGTSTALADLSPGAPEVCTARCDEGLAEVLLPVQNTGLADTAPFVVVLENGEGIVASTELALVAGQVRVAGPFALSREAWGDGLRARLDTEASVEECDETDNTVALGAWPCPIE